MPASLPRLNGHLPAPGRPRTAIARRTINEHGRRDDRRCYRPRVRLRRHQLEQQENARKIAQLKPPD
jgi:hypothetical protein